MDADTSHHKPSEQFDLRQVSVDLIKSLDLLLDKLFDQALRVAIREVNLWVKILGVLGCTSATERENNTWKQVLRLDREKRLLEVRLLLTLLTTSGAGATTT